MKEFLLPPALMIPSERTNCACSPDPAGELGAQVEGTVGALACAEQPHADQYFSKARLQSIRT